MKTASGLIIALLVTTVAFLGAAVTVHATAPDFVSDNEIYDQFTLGNTYNGIVLGGFAQLRVQAKNGWAENLYLFLMSSSTTQLKFRSDASNQLYLSTTNTGTPCGTGNQQIYARSGSSWVLYSCPGNYLPWPLVAQFGSVVHSTYASYLDNYSGSGRVFDQFGIQGTYAANDLLYIKNWSYIPADNQQIISNTITESRQILDKLQYLTGGNYNLETGTWEPTAYVNQVATTQRCFLTVDDINTDNADLKCWAPQNIKVMLRSYGNNWNWSTLKECYDGLNGKDICEDYEINNIVYFTGGLENLCKQLRSTYDIEVYNLNSVVKTCASNMKWFGYQSYADTGTQNAINDFTQTNQGVDYANCKPTGNAVGDAVICGVMRIFVPSTDDMVNLEKEFNSMLANTQGAGNPFFVYVNEGINEYERTRLPDIQLDFGLGGMDNVPINIGQYQDQILESSFLGIPARALTGISLLIMIGSAIFVKKTE